MLDRLRRREKKCVFLLLFLFLLFVSYLSYLLSFFSECVENKQRAGRRRRNPLLLLFPGAQIPRRIGRVKIKILYLSINDQRSHSFSPSFFFSLSLFSSFLPSHFCLSSFLSLLSSSHFAASTKHSSLYVYIHRCRERLSIDTYVSRTPLPTSPLRLLTYMSIGVCMHADEKSRYIDCPGV
ncbi:hypothetical protein CSUI_008838 [Cystoisospora suis]|uniref:Transmembrane protein n=1 Tax=Cystoisospora suis TaxID=483139 RepID=A0A2C6KLH8_9APIC|nr:hypothetical protein CSUI_008838 [Cystoisospora suis]